jgi:type IV pilus assembly protein PilB
MSHWMARVAAHAGFERVDQIDCSESASVSDVWAKTSAACGVTTDELAAAVGSFFRMEVADLEAAQPTATVLLPGSMARRFGLFPLVDANRYIEVATADPTASLAAQEVGFASGRIPEFRVAPPEAIARAIEGAYSPEIAAASLLSRVEDLCDGSGEIEIEIEPEEEPESLTEVDTSGGPMVRLTNIVLHEAVRQRASDIHIQPTAGQGVVRYRIDGVLRTGMQMPLPVLGRMISRIKILGDLDITDRLRPQDGGARIVVDGSKYDLRISTVPTRKAEKAVVRILSTQGWGTLADTGIAANDLEKIRGALSNRDGIFVVTGPTGSGKTTTLYGALQEVATEDVNIMTVEDPVEYELPGLTQIQVEHKQGVTFASALRAILRQDPDIVFVGEIRDGETAEVAAQASLTGHLVLATLHTNDAVGSIRRFIDLGLDPGTLGETLRGALAQRLVRRVCPHCAETVSGSRTPHEEALFARFGRSPVVRATGCDRCAEQGYIGRLPVTEFMSVTPELVRMVLDGAPPFELEQQAVRDGMRTLLESALDRMKAGETTLEEVERVIGSSELPVTASGKKSGSGAVVPLEHEAAACSVETADPDLEEEPPHILLVDDDGTNRVIARGILEARGYRVSEASDGSEALARLARGEHFSLMILDLDMPMLGGREVLSAVRRSLVTAGLPVLVLTGTPDPDSEVELMEQGADDYVRKPIEPRHFLARVGAALRRAGDA